MTQEQQDGAEAAKIMYGATGMTEELKITNTPAVQTSGDAMLDMIERVAVNPEADIEKMERLMNMREREFARISKQAFSADYVIMKANLPVIFRSKRNNQTNSKYAALEDINKIIDPILSSYGFSTSTRVLSQSDISVSVEAVLWHREGHTETNKVEMPLDKAGIKGTVNKTGVHALSSSITYAKRIALCALLNISTGDDVDGNRDQEPVLATDMQRTAISGLYQKLNEEQQDSFNKKTGGLLSIQKKDVNTIMAMLNNSIGNK